MSSYYVFFLLNFFNTQNRVPQIVIGFVRLIYHNIALSIVLRATVKKIRKLFCVEKNYEILIFSQIMSG